MLFKTLRGHGSQFKESTQVKNITGFASKRKSGLHLIFKKTVKSHESIITLRRKQNLFSFQILGTFSQVNLIQRRKNIVEV